MNTSDFYDLTRQAEALDYGTAKLALLEEAVRLADSLGDVDRGFEGRMDLIQAATFSGYGDRALVAFAWCLAQSDRNAGRFDTWDLMWRYKWIVGGLSSLPQIGLAKIQEMLEDFHQRCRELGYGERPYLSLHWKIAWETGAIEEGKRLFRKTRQAPRGSLTDCAACEQNAEMEWFALLREDERALNAAEPILRGRLSCAEVPEITFANLLEVLCRRGNLDGALDCHRSGYRRIARNRTYLDSTAKHLSYLAETGELAKGLKLVERHLPWALDTYDLEARLKFFGACCQLMRLLSQRKRPRRKLRLPKSFAEYRDDDTYETGALAAWFQREGEELAQRFDARNGNNYRSNRLEERISGALMRP